jgi:hypothetical protein
MILQGEVESIALMKPKGGQGEDGLLEYLEVPYNIFFDKLNKSKHGSTK